MKHDIEAINAALALGDRFMPPVGTVCVVYTRHFGGFRKLWFLCEVLAGNPDLTLRVKFISIINGKPIGDSHLTEGLGIRIHVFEITSLMSIPEDAPPFSKWSRWR